jgi:hypothetical protein
MKKLIWRKNGEVKIMETEKPIIIPKSYLKEFSQLIVIGTQVAYQNSQYSYLSQKQALTFAEKLVKLYA